MKPPFSVLALALAIVVGLSVLSSLGCASRSRPTEWRSPARLAPRAVCQQDSDCQAGLTCVVDIGATQGSCDAPPTSSNPAREDGSGGAPPSGPVPSSVQPAPGDIRL